MHLISSNEGGAMEVDEAQREVIRLYNTAYLREAGGLEARNEVVGALPFYGWLQKHHPETLSFPHEGASIRSSSYGLACRSRGVAAE